MRAQKNFLIAVICLFLGFTATISLAQEAPVGPRYVDNRDGTVTDTKTKFIWQKADDGVGRDWINASQYCASLVLGDHDDWRLPQVDELLNIVVNGKKLTINPVFDCRPLSYWSSCTDVYNPAHAWLVHFYNGRASWGHKTLANYVLVAVPDGPCALKVGSGRRA